MDVYSQAGIEPLVYLNGQQMPWKCHSVTQSAGGHNLDTAILELDAGNTFLPAGDPLHDYMPIEILRGRGDDAIVQVAIPEGPVMRVIHYGLITGTDVVLNGREASVRYTSRVEPWMFGEPHQLYAVLYKEGDQEQESFLAEQVIFNPTIDGRSWGNMIRSEKFGRHFVHPGQLQSDVALRNFGIDPENREPIQDDNGHEVEQFGAEYWRLSDAIEVVCNLNRSKKYIDHPSPEEVRGVFEIYEHDPILKHVEVRMGSYLPEILDRLLIPYGYSWRLLYGTLGMRPKIDIYKLSDGYPLPVGHQRNGEVLDPRRTTMRGMRLRFDSSNRYVWGAKVLGSPLVVEGTWELIRAWDHSLSSTDPEELRKSSERYQTDPEVQRVGRDFVLNEAGDYSETNQPPNEEGVSEPPESPNPAVKEALTRHRPVSWPPFPNFSAYVPRRRRFLPCLTQNQDGTPAGSFNGFEIEYSLDGGETWHPIVPGGDDPFSAAQPIVLLEREAGIRFEGEYPATAILENPKARLRITASLVSDVRLTGWGSGGMPTPEMVEHVFELPQYEWRVIDETSIFRTRVQTDELTSAQIDESPHINQFATSYAREWNRFDCDGFIELNGCDPVAQVGYIVPWIDGRNINLSLDIQGRSPQVMAVVYDFDTQATVLHLGTPTLEVRPQ